jgi:hypothetical protein
VLPKTQGAVLPTGENQVRCDGDCSSGTLVSLSRHPLKLAVHRPPTNPSVHTDGGYEAAVGREASVYGARPEAGEEARFLCQVPDSYPAVGFDDKNPVVVGRGEIGTPRFDDVDLRDDARIASRCRRARGRPRR